MVAAMLNGYVVLAGAAWWSVYSAHHQFKGAVGGGGMGAVGNVLASRFRAITAHFSNIAILKVVPQSKRTD